jgi:hypothetical protein
MVLAVIISQSHFFTFASKENRIMAEDITLEEKLHRFDAALNNLRLAVESDTVVSDEIFDEFLLAAQDDRRDMRYKALLGSAGRNSNGIP